MPCPNLSNDVDIKKIGSWNLVAKQIFARSEINHSEFFLKDWSNLMQKMLLIYLVFIFCSWMDGILITLSQNIL